MYESLNFDNGSDITLWCDGIHESGNSGGEPPSKKRKTDGQAVVSDSINYQTERIIRQLPNEN